MLSKPGAALATLVLLGALWMPRPADAAKPSANLIAGGDAEAGYCSKDFNTATTLPGWKIEQGSPAVICYSATQFAHPAGSAGRAFFAPGAEGNATVSQVVDVRSAAKRIDTGRVTYELSAWLGGHSNYPGHAVVSLAF